MAERSSSPYVIGVLGGVASGKSLVARLFGEQGARVIDADALAREAVTRPSVQEAIRTRFGDELIRDGDLDRQALARVVFDDPDAREDLETIVHPAVLEDIADELERGRKDGERVLVLDAPLLVETGLHEVADLLVFVDTPLEIRQRRAEEDRDWDPEEIERRESSQASLEKKRNLSDVVVTNAGPVDSTRDEVRHIWETRVPAGPERLESGTREGP